MGPMTLRLEARYKNLSKSGGKWYLASKLYGKIAKKGNKNPSSCPMLNSQITMDFAFCCVSSEMVQVSTTGQT